MSEVTQSIPSLEERFALLERQFADLRAEVLGLQPRTKDWRRTVGMMPDDELSRSAARLGREWRDNAE
jgi:hypothetical protein